MMSGNMKIVVALHEGEKETKKNLRFNPDLWKEYTLEATVKEITQQKKRLSLRTVMMIWQEDRH